MKDQHQTAQITNGGLSKTDLREQAIDKRERVKKILSDLEMFNADLAIEKALATEDGVLMPVVEAPIQIIEHFNVRPGMMEAFRKVGFFIYQDAIICEKGNREKVEASLELQHQQTPDVYLATLPPEPMKQPVARFKRKTTADRV